jgi:hypothetical protein
MVRSRSPPNLTSPTPSMVSRRFLTTLRAYSLSCCRVRSPVRASHMTGIEPNSTLATTGGSASFGRRGRTWLIFACTSLKPMSTSLPSPNRTNTTETPGADVLRMCSMPGTLLTVVSIRLEMLESMISGLAPGRIVRTEIIGKSISGKRSTPIRSKLMMPNNSSAPDSM